MAENTLTTPTLVAHDAIIANPTAAIRAASRALATLALLLERGQVIGTDRIEAVCGIFDIIETIRGTLSQVADTVEEDQRFLELIHSISESIFQFEENSPTSFPMITGPQCKNARELLGWSHEQLASIFGLRGDRDGETIQRFERRGGMHGISRRRLAAIFIKSGIEFHQDGSVRLNNNSGSTVGQGG